MFVLSFLPGVRTQPQEKTPVPGLQTAPNAQEQVVKKDDVAVYTALILLQDNLPRGTRMTSGFRTARDQLRILRHFAQIEGLPIPPNMSIDRPETWRPLLVQVRERKYIIAEPGNSPHESDDLIVFDLSRADLGEIERACYAAQKRGVVRIHRTIREPKNGALHVELEVTQRGLLALGAPQLAESQSDALQLLRDAREKAKDDPAKQIDISFSMRNLLDNYSDQRVIDDEILKFQERIREIDRNNQKSEALAKIHEAKREGRLEDAVGLARQFKLNFSKEPEAEGIVAQYETPWLVEQAIDLYLSGNCESYFLAREKAEDALKLSSSDKPAQRTLNIIDAANSRCSSQWYMRIILSMLFVVGIGAGLYFLFRSEQWVLAGIDGVCRGEIYPIDSQSAVVMIGALGPQDGGEADIVISDRKRRISREHCKIYRDGRKFFIKDVSANGTSINGRRLENDEVRQLRKNDEISLADAAILRFSKKAYAAQTF